MKSDQYIYMVGQDYQCVFVGDGWRKLGSFRDFRPHTRHNVLARGDYGGALGSVFIGK